MSEYLKRVYLTLLSKPSVEELPFLLEAYAKVSVLAADAAHEADEAELTRRTEEANEWLAAKKNHAPDEKPVSDSTADKLALVATHGLRRAESAAKGKSVKYAALRESVREAINGIKFLGRFEGQVNVEVE